MNGTKKAKTKHNTTWHKMDTAKTSVARSLTAPVVLLLTVPKMAMPTIAGAKNTNGQPGLYSADRANRATEGKANTKATIDATAPNCTIDMNIGRMPEVAFITKPRGQLNCPELYSQVPCGALTKRREP